MLDEAIGSPSKQITAIHIAGTNGKGSVSSMLASALSASGKRIGLYTSPHLVDFRERARIVSPRGFELVPAEYVWNFIEKYEPIFEQRSFFEITTALAFKWFADSEVDLAVIETGLGGRFDSTNIIVPQLSVITSIGLDHCAILGNTRAEIAYEKAGIIKGGVPVVVSVKDLETAPVFEAEAQSKSSPIYFVDTDDNAINEYDLDLRGPYQGMNLATVLKSLEVLGVDVDKTAIEKTASRTGFRGRWEKLLDNPETICDIGHNPPALKINFDKLKKCARPLIMVYGIMADKDLDSIAPMMPVAAKYILVAPITARALPAEELQRRLKSLRPELDTVASKDIETGLSMAVNLSKEFDNPLIYIGGSTFVVCEAIKYFEQ